MTKIKYNYSNLANLPTAYGSFKIQSFKDEKGNEHAILIKGDVENRADVPVRIHSECLTGDAFSSLKCDCNYQLNYALEYISMFGFGIIIYLRQEGRGIGFFNKINAYNLQDNGRNTIEANHDLGLNNDEREYSAAVEVLNKLNIQSVKLMTNNPLKIEYLKKYGINVIDRVSVISKKNTFNDQYLEVKKHQLSHML
ncbi:GTP cyclohydrolase II [Mariniflexile litorale]|uniref:GTP cyclohydrolase-2 n=1 Tax=Mariniflexile litorale TaxID=3045158 RepID=A0AAU7EFQ9_9FLAO|nr:GTP cyclohydrolase II [Mariniflexile sp. KMM 9835]MDQ8212282.1 GTP cyclohydrolase II [Mariniflexile sp. KMM 9835]